MKKALLLKMMLHIVCDHVSECQESVKGANRGVLDGLLKDEVPKMPAVSAAAFTKTIEELVAKLKQVGPSAQEQQDAMDEIAQAAVGLAIAVDFFNTAYPNKEAYANQSVIPPAGATQRNLRRRKL